MIKKGQIYKSNSSNVQVEIAGKKCGKWLAKILTEKAGVYKGSHRFAERTLYKQFTLIF